MAPFGTKNRGMAEGYFVDLAGWQWITEVENGTFGRPVPFENQVVKGIGFIQT
jgi:hypothetical protein